MPDWDAARYHRLSGPQVGWGRKVLDRLAPLPGEEVLDVGCGTGRLTMEIGMRTGILVVGLDYSAAMLEEGLAASRGTHAAVVGFVRADGASLPFRDDMFDAVFSGATFHWITDHDRLFTSIHRVLKPAGRLVAQSGGGPNLQRLLDRTHRIMESGPYSKYFNGWSDPWLFAGIDDTRARLERAGFESIEVSLEEAPTTFDDAATFANFISCVCVRHHVDRLPADARETFVAELARLAAGDDPPFTLDYWRLNVSARKARR
jgi:ubiquinone/menaquinone biosynthesis C-methylase UbiE